jgi:hypothetical protein
MERPVPVNRQVTHRRATQAVRLVEDRIEHWREIAGRRVDDLQHLGARGLLGKRLITLGFALGKLSLQIG